MVNKYLNCEAACYANRSISEKYRSKNGTVVEYAFKNISKPIGVSEYIITKNLPDKFKFSLPGIEEIEAELSGG